MIQPTVQVDGLRKLTRELRAAGEDLTDLKDANARAGSIVLDAARPATPRRTGRLAATGRTNRAAAKANVLFGSAAVPYAGPIHWGWKSRHIPAQPWVQTAAKRTQGQWIAAYEADIQRVLDNVKGE